MALKCLSAVLFFFCTSEVSGLGITNRSSLTCDQMVPCEININHCVYKEWLKPQTFTPTSPVDLKVHVDVTTDERGYLVPVIVAEWKARDDGSIIHLTGTEFQVTKQGNGEHICVHYIFLKKITTMRNEFDEQWSFTLDKVIVDPDETYLVSVSNLPKPNIAHTSYNINKTIKVSGCKSPAMQKTQICIERGDNWNPNISMVRSGPQDRTLFIAFDTDEHSETYKVHVKCKQHKETQNLSKENMSSLNVTFDLEAWPHTCCSFTVEIQPFFKCGNDCLRKKRSFNICPADPPKAANSADGLWKVFTGLFVVFCGLCAICAICLRYRKQQKGPAIPLHGHPTPDNLPDAEHSVLIIYSRDHPKYTDIVLKLCAFLRAKCGTEVYLDLLDTASIGAMGRLQWMELQMRRIEQSSAKVLVLCSRGVQAKWGAMCGGPQVLLHEDVCSPMGDMLTLALQLITPDMQRPASYGKYLVAYFEDICGERDVPSMFDLAVKYKLMKHFEELFFRILDLEKYQKGKVNAIKGIGIDDYINCPSGKALRDAIETFQAYQLENPDWFEKECLDSEDEVPGTEISPFLNECPPQVLKCDPVLNFGPSVCECKVEVHCADQTHSVWSTEIPHLNLDYEEPFVQDVQPACQVYSLHPAVETPLGIHQAGVCHANSENHPCLLIEPALQEPLPSSRNEVFVNKGPFLEDSSATDKEDALKKLLNLQVSLVSVDITAPPPSVDDQFQTSWDVHSSQPVEVDESQVEDASGRRQSRWSDQGYSSRDSMVREEPPPSSLVALAKLQEALYLNSPISSGFCTETMES
ncbi:interleukin 17 receptor A1a isoform X1 [Tachysurus vachellii]|uniref:interleukin 17 receptor A1a isoform X1 n=1 Tax=Tachysurus vachellii TaxID=175792 RepID=UPI00296AF00E|nr:interleukin 17 receptor A1a isoform X1 [Tachysurus vachellii]